MHLFDTYYAYDDDIVQRIALFTSEKSIVYQKNDILRFSFNDQYILLFEVINVRCFNSFDRT